MHYSLYSWNVNGIRAVLKKGVLQDLLEKAQPDFLCLQETKAKKDQVEVDFADYQEFWNSADRAGYSGTAIFAKNHHKILKTELNFANFLAQETDPEITKILNNLHQDQYGAPLNEGRVATVETEHFYLVTVYTPNSKNDLSRLNLRHDLWDPLFLRYIQYLERTKPVVFCGDLNVSHQEIDLARPKQNTKMPGSLKKSGLVLKIIYEITSLTLFALSTQILSSTPGGHIGDMPAKIMSAGGLTISLFPKNSNHI